MEFKISRDIDECHAIWDLLSQKKRLFDMWDYRLCFHDTSYSEPYFIVGYDGKEAIGIIPLDFVKSNSQYNYFGGWFPERNSFFLKDKTKIKQLLEQCPENTFIEGMEPSEGQYYDFLDDEYTYYLDLSKYNNNFEVYLGSFDKKRRKNLMRDIKNMPKYEIYRNRLKDLDRLVELNIKQYEEDSKFNNMAIKNGISKMVDLASKNGVLEMISLEINGKTEAVSIGILFGEGYHTLIGGANTQKIPNLGKLMLVLEIKNAIAKKARFIDFFATSGHWKERWNFDREMLLKFVK